MLCENQAIGNSRLKAKLLEDDASDRHCHLIYVELQAHYDKRDLGHICMSQDERIKELFFAESKLVRLW